VSLLVIAILFLLALLGVPLFVVLGGGALFAFFLEGISSSAVITEMSRLASSPVLISIPLFTFAGYLFAESRAPERVVRVTRSVVGWIPGGFALVAMVACAVFTAFTGGSGVTIVAMGGLLMPALLKEGFTDRFSLGLMTSSGSLGLLFPPSLPLIIFSYVASQSVGGQLVPDGMAAGVDRLFLAGLLPGIVLIMALSALAFRQGRGGDGVHRIPFREGIRDFWPALRSAAWEVPLPILILGGIYGGKLTVTEAATLTVVYAFIVEVFIYRDIPLKRLPAIATESMVLVGGILIILGAALGLTNFLIDAEIPMRILDWVRSFITSRAMFLLALNIMLLAVGCLMDIFSALIVVVPLIVPIAIDYDVNLVHLGIIFIANLEIGYLTPPIGLNLFISSFRFRKPITEVYRASVPFLLVLLAALMVITYWSDLSLALPRLWGGP
jgi:tripartite ATP-independent transporter DctM subunit